MELRCNNCNERIVEFGCDFNADVTSYYNYDEKEGKFKLTHQELNNDDSSHFYCAECGKTLSDEIISLLEY